MYPLVEESLSEAEFHYYRVYNQPETDTQLARSMDRHLCII